MLSTSILVVLAAVSSLTAATLIGGDIHRIAFEESAGPFVVEQDALVPAGTTVVMKAGTVLLFRPFTGLRVDGEIRVEGSAEKPVVFTSVHDSRYGPGTGQLPNAFDWNGVLLSPQCTDARFRHLHLMYSVYGIKSQMERPQLQDCVFEQNGQFNFTINDKIQYVQDRIPFSNVSGAATAEAKPQTQQRPARDDWAPKVRKTPRGVNAFRYVCLGSGVAAAGAGAYFAVKASQAADKRDAVGVSGGNADTWDKAQQDYESAVLGTSVSFGLSGLLLLGFAVTFFF